MTVCEKSSLIVFFLFSFPKVVIHIRYKALAELPDWDEDVPPCTVEGDCSEPLGKYHIVELQWLEP